MSESAPFGQYRSFSFGYTEESPTDEQPSPRTLEVERRVRDLVGSALRRRGYVEENTNPSFVVRFGAGFQRMGTRGFEESNPMRSDDEDYVDLQELKLDVFDAGTKTRIWRGYTIS